MTTGEFAEWSTLNRDSWPEWGLGAAILTLIAEKDAAEARVEALEGALRAAYEHHADWHEQVAGR